MFLFWRYDNGTQSVLSTTIFLNKDLLVKFRDMFLITSL